MELFYFDCYFKTIFHYVNICVSVYVCNMCSGTSGAKKTLLDPLDLELHEFMSNLMIYMLYCDLGSLKEHPMLSTTEPFFWLQVHPFKTLVSLEWQT